MDMQSILENTAFIFAIALQLSAALLLIGNTNTKPKELISSYCSRHKAIAFDENGELVDRSDLENVVFTTWVNNFAFKFLFFGYLLSIFGKCSISRSTTLLIVLFITCVIILLSNKCARRKSKSFESLQFDNMPHEKGVMILRKHSQK